MAKLSNKEIIESIKEKTILEVKELVDLMKEEFGVDPSSVAVSAPVAEVAEEESSTKNIVLKGSGANKLQVIKIIREITGLGLKEAKDIADAGGTIKENVANEEANEVKTKLEEVGATVELV